MPRIGYHCSHEQFRPSELLGYLKQAESAGFQSGMCSDHYFPWTDEQGESGYAWSWLGAALEATKLTMGVVTVPGGWRYHPAVMAQAAATLNEMYPERFWLATGSGEGLNEHIVGEHWPSKDERNARLLESVEIMRALWAGETVTHRGRIRVEEAKLYTLPAKPPRVVGPALSEATARWMGGWADALVTTAGDHESMRKILNAFREGGGEGKPVFLQAQLAYAETDKKAVEGAWEQWRSLILPAPVLGVLRMPVEFEGASSFVTRADVEGKIRCSSDTSRHLDWLMEFAEMGFEEINLHNVCKAGQERFIADFGAKVLPEVPAGVVT